ncbi:MAG: hypothetical protein ACXABO_09065 [Promethearchaeota archaeon]
MGSERIEIVDFSGEKFSNLSIPCWVITVIVSIIVILEIYLTIMFPGSNTILLLSIGLIFVFILYFFYVINKSPGKLRRFSISTQDIEFTLPYNPQIIISWSDFEKIEVKLKEIDIKPFYVYHFHFLCRDSEKKVIISLLDFHKEKITEILKILKKHALLMKKEFSAVKETSVSGVYLIEELEIS